MKKMLAFALLALVWTSSAVAQQMQPPVLETPVQYSAQNFVQGAGGASTSIVTITAVAGQRVRIYQVSVVCNTAGGNLVPTVTVTDGASGVFASFGAQVINNITTPIFTYRWNPGLTLPSGTTAVISGNVGGACTGGTTLNIQADQF